MACEPGSLMASWLILTQHGFSCLGVSVRLKRSQGRCCDDLLKELVPVLSALCRLHGRGWVTVNCWLPSHDFGIEFHDRRSCAR